MLVLNLSRRPLKLSLCPSFSFSLSSLHLPKPTFPVTRCEQVLRLPSPQPLCSSCHGTVVRSAGEHNRYQVIRFLVDLVRLRMLTCPRLPLLF